MRYHNKEETMKADKEILYNVIGYIICDLFLIWYLPNDTWLEIGINIVIMIVVMFGVYMILDVILKRLRVRKNYASGALVGSAFFD